MSFVSMSLFDLENVVSENLKQIRWKQRFQNFEKAYLQLKKAVDLYPALSDLEKEGLIQRFEYTFELAWKTLKDYLENQQVPVKFPRDTIKQAFHYELIADGDVWMDMLEKRNLIAHTYDEKNFQQAVTIITNQYFSALTQLFAYLQGHL